jgi:biotin carboxyl carrier protein
MEIKVDDIPEVFEGKIIGFDKDDNLVIQIDGSDHVIKVIDMKSDKFEFLFDNSFHEIKILEVTSTELKILLDGQSMLLK